MLSMTTPLWSYPPYQGMSWLTSVGDHEQDRIARNYFPEIGNPETLVDMIRFSKATGLPLPVYTQAVLAERWSAPLDSLKIFFKTPVGWAAIGAVVILTIVAYNVAKKK